MKIISLLSTLLFLTTSLCQSYPISLAILQHPTTKARVVLIGDRHYDIDDMQENAKELSFEQFLPWLHRYISTHGYTLLFEGNEYDEQQARNFRVQHPTVTIRGLQKLNLDYALHKDKLPYCKPCDPRIKNIKIFMRIYNAFNKIAKGMYDDIIEYFTQLLKPNSINNKNQIQEWLDDVSSCENYPASCLNYFLHEEKDTLINYNFLLASLTRHICAALCIQPQELATVTPFNFFLDIKLLTSSLYNGLFKHELLTPYKLCAAHIKNTHEHFIHDMCTFQPRWKEVEKLPLPQALMTLLATDEDNDLGFLCGHNRSDNTHENTENFYTKLFATGADTSMCLAILNHPKSVLYAGADHCSVIKEWLKAGGFVCIFEQNNTVHQHNDSQAITNFNTFCTHLTTLEKTL